MKEQHEEETYSWEKMKRWWRIGSLFRWGILLLLVVMIVAIGGSLIFIKEPVKKQTPGAVASDTISGDTLFEPTRTIHIPGTPPKPDTSLVN